MAVITLGELRGYWKRVSDWISGATTDAPKVTLSGSFVTKQNITPAGVTGTVVPAGTVWSSVWVNVSNYNAVFVMLFSSGVFIGKAGAFIEFDFAQSISGSNKTALTIVDNTGSGGGIGSWNYPISAILPMPGQNARLVVRNADTIDLTIGGFSMLGIVGWPTGSMVMANVVSNLVNPRP